MRSSLITLNDIKLARSRISGIAIHTPIVQLIEHPRSPPLYLKAECLQPIGAFKIRGAYNKIASLSVAEKTSGVIAFSSGNHAQGVAYAAGTLGIDATIVMPSIATTIKKEQTRRLGATIVEVGDGSDA